MWVFFFFSFCFDMQIHNWFSPESFYNPNFCCIFDATALIVVDSLEVILILELVQIIMLNIYIDFILHDNMYFWYKYPSRDPRDLFFSAKHNLRNCNSYSINFGFVHDPHPYLGTQHCVQILGPLAPSLCRPNDLL